MSDDLKFLIELVKKASEIITDEFEVNAKDDNGDLVTNFDYEVEKYIIDEINTNYPEFSIVSEEYNSNNELTENCFTVDPIDGTINFAKSIPLWGIQIACIRNKQTVAAVIYLPKLDELFYADESGAYLNGKSIHVNSLDIKKGAYAIEGPKNQFGEIKMRNIAPHYRDFHCAAVNFAWVACGRLSAVNFIWHTLWDYIPGEYIVKQAGGVIYDSYNMHIAANNEEFLQQMKDNASIDEVEKAIILKK